MLALLASIMRKETIRAMHGPRQRISELAKQGLQKKE